MGLAQAGPNNMHLDLYPLKSNANVLFLTKEGQMTNMDDVENVLTKDQIKHIQVSKHCRITSPMHIPVNAQTVCGGTWLNKFSNEGRGPTHLRFTWVNPSNTKVKTN